MSLLGSGGGGGGAVAVATSADLALCGDNVCHLHLDGAQGAKVFTDSAPGGGTLTCVGSTIALDQTSKQHGTASLFLNETSLNYIECPLRGRLLRTDREITWEMWVNGNACGHDQRVLLSDPGGPGIYLKSDMRPVFTGSSLGGGAFEIIGTAIATGTWVHLAATYSQGKITLWANGTATGTPVNLGYPLFLYENFMYLGDPGGSGGFNGHVDEVRVSRVNRYPAAFTPSTSAFTDASAVAAGLAGEIRLDGSGGAFMCVDATTQDWRRVA
jgi:hypothetical protein